MDYLLFNWKQLSIKEFSIIFTYTELPEKPSKYYFHDFYNDYILTNII